MNHLKANTYIYLLVKCNTPFKISIISNGVNMVISNGKLADWTWIKYPINIFKEGLVNTMQIKALSNYVLIDKINISDGLQPNQSQQPPEQ